MARRAVSVVLAAVVALWAANASAGLIHRYLMDDGSGATVADSVGTSAGTVKSGGGWTTGKFGDAWDGTASGFISIPNTGISTSEGTFVQWVKVSTSAANWSNPLASHFIDPDYTPYPLRHEISGPTPCERAYVYGIPNGQGNGGAASLATTTVVKDDTWHQWVTTYSASTGNTTLYIDGVQRASVGGYNTTGVVENPTWLLAARYENGGGRCPGVYDNTAVYDNALTPGQVKAIYHASTDGVTLGLTPDPVPGRGLRHLYSFGAGSHPTPDVVLDSVSSHDGVVSHDLWVADTPPQNEGGWRKTGDEWVLLPIKPNMVEGTFEGWFKTDAGSPNWSNPFTTSIRSLTEPHLGDAMRIEVANDATYIFDSPGAGTVTAPIDTADGLWHLLALTYEDGETVKLYIDGALAGSSPSDYTASAAYDRGFTMIGGRDIGSTLSWDGTAGTFAYFGSALTPGAIQQHYAEGISSIIPEPATIGLLLAGLGAALWRRRRS